MTSKLKHKPQVWKLAVDLGLDAAGDPLVQIVSFVRKKVLKIAKKYGCKSLGDLLIATAAEVDTVFLETRSSAQLESIKEEYLSKGEIGFATLHKHLQNDDFGVTLKRLNRQAWEPQFVSIIDCRGDKAFRSYFTKWHELAHLLTLTSQMRLIFRRSHSSASLKDPEESVMDIIAGEVGFLSDFLSREPSDEISFETIQFIREQSCPDASFQSSLIGIVKGLPQPCILVRAELGLRKAETAALEQLSLVTCTVAAADPPLRAVQVTVNRAARDLGILFHKNWRVPENSAIYEAHRRHLYLEQRENLSWWRTSGGGQLDDCAVLVRAKPTPNGVVALIIPIQTSDRHIN